MSETFTHLARQIATEAGTDLDFDGLEKVREVMSRAGARWPSQGFAILQEKNKPLLEKLGAIESHLDSLLLISNKPPALKKEFKAKLEEYEKTIEMGIDYLSRHTGK